MSSVRWKPPFTRLSEGESGPGVRISVHGVPWTFTCVECSIRARRVPQLHCRGPPLWVHLRAEPLRPRGPPSWDVAAPIRCWQTQRSQLGNCGRRLPDTHQSNSGQPMLVTSDGAAGCRGLGLRQGQPVPVGDVCPRALDGVALGFHLPHCPLWSRDRIRQCALSGPGDGCFGAGSLRRSAARSPVLSPCLGGCGGHEGPAGGGAWVSSSLRTVSPRARAHPRSVIVSL